MTRFWTGASAQRIIWIMSKPIAPWLLLLTVSILTACTPQPTLVSTSDPIAAGATDRSQEKLGYTLRNDLLQITLNPTTGDVAYLGAPTGKESFLAAPAGQDLLITRIAGHESLAPAGYVEARDEQTWQYIGEDSLLRWRKIYSLDHNRIIATFLVQNISDQPITFSLILSGQPATGWTRQSSGPDLTTFSRKNPEGADQTLEFRGFVIRPDSDQPLKTEEILRSDEFALPAGARISFTTEWTWQAMAPVPEIPISAQPGPSTSPVTVPQ